MSNDLKPPVEQHEAAPADSAEEMRDAAMRTVQAMGLVYTPGSDRWRPGPAQPAIPAPLEGTGNGADERAAFDMSDAEWCDVFERLQKTVPNVFGSYMKVRAEFAREVIRIANAARAPRTEVAGAVSDGWKLVPIEPTVEMLDHGHHQIDFDRSQQNTRLLVDESHLDESGVGTTIEQDMRDAWAAMLANAPQPPSADAAAAPADWRAAFPQIPDLVKSVAWLTMCLRTELSRLDDTTHKALDEVEAQLCCVRAITNGAIDYEAMVARAAASQPAAEPTIPAELHPDTAKLVRRFARALANKLLSVQRKYGYSDNWMRDDWADECRAELMRHIQKGDPRDVAAYCAFLWHHNESTAAAAGQEAVRIGSVEVVDGRVYSYTFEQTDTPTGAYGIYTAPPAQVHAILATQQPEPRAEVADSDLAKQLAAAKLDALKLQRSGQIAATMSHNHIVAMQAAWIEWQYGEGAEGAMEWIENTLEGPGLIPNPDEPHYRDAQAYFDANRSLKLYDETLDAAIDAARAGDPS